jgi:putative SbcD/Mre11-related phosphoesterase
MIKLLPPFQAVLVKTQDTRVLVIADLHIGWEFGLSLKGIHVPTQTPKLLRKMMDLVFSYRPEKLLILGDVKHTITTGKAIEWRDVPEFFNELEKEIEEIYVIRGNHDGNLEPLLPENMKILPATGVVLGDVGFFHGHQWPSPTLLNCKTLVMGHVHPVIAFHDPTGFRVIRQVWVRMAVDRKKLIEVLYQKRKITSKEKFEEKMQEYSETKSQISKLFVIPSFNDFLGGRPLNEKKAIYNKEAGGIAGPILRSDAVDIVNAEIHLLDGTFLGTLKQLKVPR